MFSRLALTIAYFLRFDRLVDGSEWLARECRRKRAYVRLGVDARVVPQGHGRVDIVGRKGDFQFGEGSHLKSGTFIEASGGVKIGRFFHTGRGLTIFSTNHVWKDAERIPYSCESRPAPVTIGDCVWAGANVTILPGATIGDGAILGAGAVVRGEVPCGAIVIGNPAVIIGHRDMTHFHERYRAGDFF